MTHHWRMWAVLGALVILGGCIGQSSEIHDSPVPPGSVGSSGMPSLAGQQCPEQAYMIGFDQEGNILCRKVGEGRTAVGPDCTDPTRLVPGANLQLCQLGGRNLSQLDLNHANLMLADLDVSDLQGANLSGSNLSGASFREAKLNKANFGMTVALKAQMASDSTQARGTDFSRADLREANFEGAFLIGADFTDAIWENTRCPDGSNSDDQDKDSQTCRNNMIAMKLEVRDVPPMGKEGSVSNNFGIGVKATINCVTLNEDGSVNETRTMQEINMEPQSTHDWSGNCPFVPPQTSKVTIQASPRFP